MNMQKSLTVHFNKNKTNSFFHFTAIGSRQHPVAEKFTV